MIPKAKRQRLLQVQHNKALQETKNKSAADREAVQKALNIAHALFVPCTDLADIEVNPGKNSLVDEQLNYHRKLDPEIPIRSQTPRRAEKITALLAAVARYNKRQAVKRASEVAGTSEQPGGAVAEGSVRVEMSDTH